MSEAKPDIEKGPDKRGTGRFHRHQARSRNFVHKKENPAGRCEYIRNDTFDLVLQGQNKLFTNFLKALYYICGIKFLNNRSDVHYTVTNLSNPAMSVPTEPAFEACKTMITMVQKGILDAKIKKSSTERKL